MLRMRGERGITIIEVVAALAIIGVVATIAVPNTTKTLEDLRLRGDARDLHNTIGLAKMRGAAKFTRVRVNVDLGDRSYRTQYWDKGTADWMTEGGTTDLSSGVSFSFSELDNPPPNTQAAIQQAANCLTKDGEAIGNTACVVFNSRGIPIDSAGAPTGNTGFYLSDGTGVYAITVSATPLVRLWWSPAAHEAWVHR